MTPEQMNRQIDRLRKTYGPDKYPQERADVLWKEFKGLSEQDFEWIITRLIGECSTPPMVPKFREAQSKLRERSWTVQKKENSASAKQGFSNAHHPESSAGSFDRYIVGVIEGGSASEDFHWAAKVWGLPKMEEIYERVKKGGAA